MEDFKVGDVVRLNSCSRKMTVIGIENKSNEVICGWFFNDEYNVITFDRLAIYKVENNTKETSKPYPKNVNLSIDKDNISIITESGALVVITKYNIPILVKIIDKIISILNK